MFYCLTSLRHFFRFVWHLKRIRTDFVSLGSVTQTLFGSCINWIYDPAPRRATVHSSNTSINSRDTPVLTSDNQASAIATRTSTGAPLTLPLPRKCRQRRRRKAHHSANGNSAPHSASTVTPDERWDNQNSVFQRATQHQPEASDPTPMKSAAVYKGQSIHSPCPTQPPISATNRNSAFSFGLERCEFPGLYKPALPDLRQDLTAGTLRVNNSG